MTGQQPPPGPGLPSGLAGPARQALAAAGHVILEQFTQVTEADLARMRGIGPDGTAESILGGLLAADRDHFVIGTKYSLNVRDGDLNAGGNHRKSLVQALEASLRRLRTGYVDILWLHTWDYLTPPEEVMRALDDQVRLGKVLYLGVSDTPAWVVAQMQTLAAARGCATFAGLQIEYSLCSARLSGS